MGNIIGSIIKSYKAEIQSIKDRDPAATSTPEILTYAGLHAVAMYRVAHWFYIRDMKFVARVISQTARFLTGIEIHPGAKIGKGLLIDHGAGVVIGETAEIGDNCLLYQGCTLGGTGKDQGKRHPTLGLETVPPNCTAVGVPARIVRQNGRRTLDLDQVHIPDPVSQELCKDRMELERLRKRVEELEKRIGQEGERNE
ncbi:serine O-acetyltransferase [uncultured Ruminococcus sp.]|uniref:serine O-acetyltransferase n=1 Tax=uncultured Ruminococcus sp. TaxID=165186 RepID=UPI0025F55A85|nr:serine O-acetyltransferase [uncultured Ruminococcus sp.]